MKLHVRSESSECVLSKVTWIILAYDNNTQTLQACTHHSSYSTTLFLTSSLQSIGDVLDKNGNTLGKAERYQEEEAVPEPEAPEEVVDRSLLEGKKVNKAGNVVDDNGKLFGHIVSGVLAKLIGKRCDKDGKIWGEAGKQIGQAELIPAEDRDEKAISEFEDFPGATIDRHGNVIFEDQVVGKLIEGDARKLVGKKIDQDGEVVDRLGNVLGRAERYIEEDAAPEPEPEKVDLSALAGKRVNKAGNIVDNHGDIYGILVEGDAKKLAGRMCDKNGHVFDEGGNVVGRAELVSAKFPVPALKDFETYTLLFLLKELS